MQDEYQLHHSVLRAEPEEVSIAIGDGANVDQLDGQGYSPLHWAVLAGYYDIVKLLLEAGANPNVLSSDGYTPK